MNLLLRRRALRRKARGFTLVELVVALAVAAMLLATVPVAFDRLYDAMVYRSTVRELLTELKAARQSAMRSAREVRFAFDPQAHVFGIDGQPPRALSERLSVTAIVARADLAGEQRALIRFYPDGSSTGGSLELRRANGAGVRLRVDWLFGRVSQEPLEG